MVFTAVWWEPWCRERNEETCRVLMSRDLRGHQPVGVHSCSATRKRSVAFRFRSSKNGRDWWVTNTKPGVRETENSEGDVGLNRSNSTVCSQTMAQRSLRAMIKFILMVNKQGQTRLAWSLKGASWKVLCTGRMSLKNQWFGRPNTTSF